MWSAPDGNYDAKTVNDCCLGNALFATLFFRENDYHVDS